MPNIKINQQSLHYLDTGNGFPLLLGHSFLFNQSMWQPQIEALSQNYRLIVPELWGHGYSDELPTNTTDLADLAKQYLQLLDALDIKQFGIIGLSVGGMWGVELATLAPDRVQALVLMGSYVGAEPALTRELYSGMLDSVEKLGAIPPGLTSQIAPIFFNHHPAPDLVNAFIHQLQLLSSDQLRHSIVPLGRLIFGRKNRLELLDKINTPSLVITGAEDRPRPVKEGQEMSIRLGCEHIIIPNTGHISTLEAPQEINHALLSFLKEAIPNQDDLS